MVGMEGIFEVQRFRVVAAERKSEFGWKEILLTVCRKSETRLSDVYCLQENRESENRVAGNDVSFSEGNRIAGSKEIHCPDCRKHCFHSDGNNLTGLSEIGLRMEGNPFAGLPSNPMPSSGNLCSGKGNPLSGQRNPFSG